MFGIIKELMMYNVRATVSFKSTEDFQITLAILSDSRVVLFDCRVAVRKNLLTSGSYESNQLNEPQGNILSTPGKMTIQSVLVYSGPFRLKTLLLSSLSLSFGMFQSILESF